MDFQIASDLHLEFRGGLSAPASAYPRRLAPILALCGDIYPFARSDYPEILRRVAEPFDMVMYIPGNHEYYGGDIGMDPDIERACFSIGNVVYMNKRSIDIRGMQFIGATLWTNNPTDQISSQVMNDYSSITGMTPKISNAMHREHRNFLFKAVKRAKNSGQIGAVVLSHHVPDDRLAFGIANRPEKSFPFYFSDDMRELTDDPFIQAWVHGHTHESYRTRLQPEGPIFASNAAGYPSEDTGYRDDAILRFTAPPPLSSV